MQQYCEKYNHILLRECSHINFYTEIEEGKVRHENKGTNHKINSISRKPVLYWKGKFVVKEC